jgi:homoserine dehydrogenase
VQIYNLCLLGFGNVGQALVRHLQAQTATLRERYGIEWRLTGVATRRMGWIADPAGLDATALLAGQLPALQTQLPHDVHTWLRAAQADVLFELTSTEPHTGQPAIEHLRAALEYGAHAITANKGTLVHGYQELRRLAQEQGKHFFFEGTVMAGAPFFSLFRYNLPLARIERVRALFNSTANVIIAEMEAGKSFAEGIRTAQDIGIAETDPTLDIDGWDAAVKVCAVAHVLLDVPLRLPEMEIEGIRGLTPALVQHAKQSGTPYKLVATLEWADRQAKTLLAYVRPEKLALSDPLAAAGPAALLAHLEMDLVPGLTITVDVPMTGTAGPDVTAYDALADFIRAVQL